MKVVPVTTAIIDDVVAVFIKAYNQPPWNYGWTADRAKQYLLEYMNCGNFTGFVLYDDNDVAGAVFGHTKTWWTGRQLMIDELFISSEKQRKGYGKMLLDYCDRYAADNQLSSIVLMTNKYMPSFGFYDKNGYTTAGQYVFMFR